MKKFICSLCLGIMLVLCTFGSVFAAPKSLPANVNLTSNLITVTNPPAFSTTTQKGVVFCGYGKSGTTLYFYEYDKTSNTYKPVLVDGKEASLTINASGVFWKKLNFSSGYHKVIVYAESGSSAQSVKREINVISSDIMDRLKSFSINVNSFVKKGI